MNIVQLCQAPMLANYSAFFLKNPSQPTTLALSLHSKHLEMSLQLAIDGDDSISCEKDNMLGDLDSNPHDETEYREYVEMQRRRKIGLANKGKIPWNKGKKHKAETRELIKQRTLEALRNPKVKKKMSVFPRVHSEESKAKIGAALKRVWKERLERKRLQDIRYLVWATCIANAAKVGFHEQEELEWDSYEKIKDEMKLEYLQRKEEKARAKELAKLKATRAAKTKEAKTARIAQARKDKEQKRRSRLSKRTLKEQDDQKVVSAFSRLKIKDKLTKLNGAVSALDARPTVAAPVRETECDVEKWDLKFIRKEKMRKRVSFAEQIRAAKSRKAASNTNDVQTNL